MKKNQANWIKWYLAATGREWREEDEGAAPDLSGLSDREAAIGTLLYNRYIRERQDSEDLRYAEATAAADYESEARRNLQTAKRVALGLAETAIAKGRQGTPSVESEMARLQQAEQSAMTKTQARRTADRARLLENYAAKRNARDEQLAKDVASTERHYEQLWRRNWSLLKQNLSRELPDIVSAFDTKTYTAEGVADLRRQLEEHRDELGEQYGEALRWVDSLPVYQGSTDGTVLQVAGNSVVVDKRDMDMLDVVQYKGGAGNKVSKSEIFRVVYESTDYYIKAGAQVNADTAATLDALASAKQLQTGVGTILYYDNALYVYSGDGKWLATDDVLTGSGRHSRRKLLARLSEMQ